MDERSINQGELALAIKDVESSGARVSCDFTIKAGSGRQVMFYFTDMFLGSPNRTERVDKACIEPKDVTGPYEIVPTGENYKIKTLFQTVDTLVRSLISLYLITLSPLSQY